MKSESIFSSFPLISLRKRMVFILPTRFGWLFILILLSMLAGSANYNNNLGFLLTFLLGSIAFVSMLHTFRNISGVKVISVNAKPVFAGKKALFRLLIQVKKYNRRALKFQLEYGGSEIIDVIPLQENVVILSMRSRKRGALSVGKLLICTTYPLGLFYAWTKISLNSRCIIYPQPLPFFRTMDPALGRGAEKGAERTRGDTDFQGFSLYRPGDPIKRISWKAFSRGQGLLVKNFQSPSGLSVLFSWENLKGIETEQRISILCQAILTANGLNMAYGLKLPGQTIFPANGESHKHRCLKTLALFSLEGSQ